MLRVEVLLRGVESGEGSATEILAVITSYFSLGGCGK